MTAYTINWAPCPGNNFLLEIYDYGLWVFLHIGMQRTKENIPFHSYVVLKSNCFSL